MLVRPKPQPPKTVPPPIDDRNDPRFLLRKIIKEDYERTRPTVRKKQQDMVRELMDATVRLEIEESQKFATKKKNKKRTRKDVAEQIGDASSNDENEVVVNSL